MLATASSRPLTWTTVVLVRHAEKKGDLIDPDLTAGRSDARRGAREGDLEAFLSGIIVTDTKRTQETAAPAARAHHLVPIVIDKSDVKAWSRRSISFPAGARCRHHPQQQGGGDQ
jgi:broad specificity phosphatase PhoE